MTTCSLPASYLREAQRCKNLSQIDRLSLQHCNKVGDILDLRAIKSLGFEVHLAKKVTIGVIVAVGLVGYEGSLPS